MSSLIVQENIPTLKCKDFRSGYELFLKLIPIYGKKLIRDELDFHELDESEVTDEMRARVDTSMNIPKHMLYNI